ncbi:MAG: pyridoxal phosphate-dependent aminotransferase [Planctomycetota bacterium]|nr:pyridoxal phosphate-dependent aminotransferase [Planctomycetota bacterium]MDA1113451.1 pyridoxal phosphate-dependent aminotransferase [Planctomycetota bacterium]
MPTSVSLTSEDFMYPKAYGTPKLRDAIADYYNRYYGCSLEPENVMIFAGGRPALVATLMFQHADVEVRVASTEYTPYYDMLRLLGRDYSMVESSEANGFYPSTADYLGEGNGRKLIMLSNPCNPTGITRTGSELEALVRAAESMNVGVLMDEAYEMFHEPPVSALEFVKDINQTNLFVAGAATKGLQAPGIRVGWIIASKENIEVLSNFSSFGMGGVSHPSQLFALELFEQGRVDQARKAVPTYYREQRDRYAEAFEKLGLELFSGKGGFYHWCKLPGSLTASELNQRLFLDGAAILKGTDCDMARGGEQSTLNHFMRFSFGPLAPESFDSDISIMRAALRA